MNAPQIIMIVIIAVGFFHTAGRHGEDKGKYNIYTWTLSAALEVGLLIWGGFF